MNAFMHYTADSINLAAQNKYIQKTFTEAVKPKRSIRDDRTAEKIAEDVIKKAGIKLVG